MADFIKLNLCVILSSVLFFGCSNDDEIQVTGVLSGNEPKGGALVVAYNGTVGFSSVTDQNGDYNIHNVSAGDYSVKAFLASHNSSELNISVTTAMETSSTDLQLSTGATGQVTGQITFLSTQNIEVDIALTHPGTGETDVQDNT